MVILFAVVLVIVDFCVPNYLRQTAERVWLFVSVPVQRFNLSEDTLIPYSVILKDNNEPCRLMSFEESQRLRSMGDHWSDRFVPMIGGSGRILVEHAIGSVLRNRYRFVGGVRGVETVTLFPIMETEAKECQAISLQWCGHDDSKAPGKLITIGGSDMNCVTALDWPEIVAKWDFVLDKKLVLWTLEQGY